MTDRQRLERLKKEAAQAAKGDTLAATYVYRAVSYDLLKEYLVIKKPTTAQRLRLAALKGIHREMAFKHEQMRMKSANDFLSRIGQ